MTRRIARRVVAPVVVLSLAAAAGGATLVLTRDDDSVAESETTTTALTTAEVTRRDLVISESYDGTLGFGDSKEIASSRSGIVTGLADVGDEIAPGGWLFAIDAEPTVVLLGSTPAFREMNVDSRDGADVLQLEAALVELGYGADLTADTIYDDDTADAVERWESDLGREEPDGTVELGDVVFVARALRVNAIAAEVGSRVQSDTTIVTVTSTDKVVTIDLAVSEADDIEASTAVAVTLPGDVASTGVIVAIATEATASDDTGPGGGEPTIAVTVRLDEPDLVVDLDSGSVDVEIERERVDNALTVPVAALLALAEGGYAVEVTRNEGTLLIGVTVGTYSDGWVEVASADLAAGDLVVVPA